ncbi:MAG: Mercuric reductase [Verrucomicrobiota bacterium]
MNSSTPSREHDVIVIGGGSGGYAAARTTAAAGLNTAVIEGGAEVGGLCILRGCMPTKALLQAAEVRHHARHADRWGLPPAAMGFDWNAVMAWKDRHIRDFADYRAGQLQDGRFAFYRAGARFLDPHTVALGTGETLRARHFVISTGSRVAPVPLPALAGAGFLTSDDALTLAEPPRSLIVLGGGAVGVEFAQFFARCDVRVTLIQRGPRLLRDLDPDASAVVEQVLRREGVEVFTGTQLVDAWRGPQGRGVAFQHGDVLRRIEADHILHALGRQPNTATLDPARAGLATDGGRLPTNEHMRTNVPHIYAAGDCTSPYEVVHLAVLQGEIAGHNIVHPTQPRAIDYRLLLNVVFTEPQAATVGLTEKEATARGIPFRAAHYPFADHGKSLLMEARDGFVKLLADPVSGEILGGACVGPAGGELIHEITVAMARRMTVQELAAVPHYHPTLAEIWTYPAEELAQQVSASAGS